jgi:hypothetical protein
LEQELVKKWYNQSKKQAVFPEKHLSPKGETGIYYDKRNTGGKGGHPSTTPPKSKILMELVTTQ